MSTYNMDDFKYVRNNSVGGDGKIKAINLNEYTQAVIRTTRNKFIAVAVAVTLVATGGGIGISRAVSDLKQSNISKEAVAPYVEMVGDNSYRTDDNKGFWYDTDAIADNVVKADDIDVGIYGAYKGMRMNTNANMNKVVSRIGNKEDSPIKVTSWEDYLKSKGFTDKDGNISTDKYEEAMQQYIVAKLNMDEANKGIGK